MGVNGPNGADSVNVKPEYDKERVLQSVKAKVKNILKEGKEIKGYTDEVDALQNLANELAGNGANVDSQNFVQGLVIEYQTRVQTEQQQAEANKQKNEISDQARKDLKDVMGKNKKIDDSEASRVLDMIKNVRGVYSQAEIEYFKQELMKAGFQDLLIEFENNNNPTTQRTDAEKPEAETPVDAEEKPADDGAGASTADTPADEPNNTNTPLPSTGADKPISKPKDKIDNGVDTGYKPRNTKFDPPPKDPVTSPAPVDNNPTPPVNKNNGLRFKQRDVANRAHLIVKASEGWGTDERMFIDNVTVGSKRDQKGKETLDNYLHNRQPLNAAEAKAIDKQLRAMTGKGLLQYMAEEFTIGGFGADNQFITDLRRQYITYGLKEN